MAMLSFSEGFHFGSATAASQIEGDVEGTNW